MKVTEKYLRNKLNLPDSSVKIVMALIKYYKILVYDIETTPLEFLGFRTGYSQNISTSQLVEGYYQKPHIMTIQYRWLHECKSSVLTWGDTVKDEKKMIEDFDKLVEQADIVIGKRNLLFDDKHINSQRLWHDLPGNPEWAMVNEDLEKSMKQVFYMTSYALDYMTQCMGFSGKKKMDWYHWKDIALARIAHVHGVKTQDSRALFEFIYGISVKEALKRGKIAWKDMLEYGLHDTNITADAILKVIPHIKLRANISTLLDTHVCIYCGSKNIQRNGTKVSGKTKYQRFHCTDHGGYAGKAPLDSKGRITSKRLG